MKIFIITCFFSVFFYSQKTNNLAITKPAIEEFFGYKIVDDYRNLENLEDPQTVDWMKSQTNYANTILNKIPNKNYYFEKRIEFDNRQGFLISNLKITYNDKYFYLKKKSNEKSAKLYFRNGFSGIEVLLYDPINYNKSEPNHEYVINYIEPSQDGGKIVVSLSEKGNELSDLIIIDVNKKSIYPKSITNTFVESTDGVKWLDDNSGFFFVNPSITNSKSENFYKNTQSVLYKIEIDSIKLVDIFSAKNNPNLNITSDQFPMILNFNKNDKYYIGMLVDYLSYRKTFIIKKNDLSKGKKNWKQLSDPSDKAKNLDIWKNDIFFISSYQASSNKLCRTNINNPNFKNPIVLVPEKKDEFIKSYRITKDGIYYTTNKNGVEAKLYLYKNGKELPIKLPYSSGNINIECKGENYSDIWVSCSGWANDEQRFKYDFKTNTFTPENLAPIIEYPEFKDVIVDEISVRSRDGEEIPLSLIYNKNIKKDGNNPMLIDSYGSYGLSNSPFFAKTYMLWANQGGIVAIAHVRGGGEKGEKWRLGGYKETKQNTWHDLIDCTEFLIKEKYTSNEKVAIWGASAGGITVGRAMTERPDLFKVVIVEAGLMNPIRDEITPNGQPKEFGSIKDLNEFKGLLEMDPLYHIKKDVKYPATYITGGINDQRVAVWEPVKFAAKLMANDSSNNPILLKIDYSGGHGANIPIRQRYSNIGDIFAFAFWQLGHPDYQPIQDH